MILVVFITYGGLIDEQIVKYLVCLGLDGVSTFQGVRFVVTTLLIFSKHIISLGSIVWCTKQTLICKDCLPC
jgi:hypothetical protein